MVYLAMSHSQVEVDNLYQQLASEEEDNIKIAIHFLFYLPICFTSLFLCVTVAFEVHRICICVS